MDINKELKQLGWSDQLIEEITRISGELNINNANQRIIEPTIDSNSFSGSEVYFESSNLNTSASLKFSNKE